MSFIQQVALHASFFHPSMWGFNVTAQTFPYDNQPVAPLTNYTFDEWWFHCGDIRQGNNVCPNQPIAEFHMTGFDDLKGCALAIAYNSNASEVIPENFTVFSVNQTCVWTRFTDFEVPERMPECPNGMYYMTSFQCNVTGATSAVPLAKAQVPRCCGADPEFGKELASLSNCTYSAKQPLYWFQAENNMMFEGAHAPPFYTDLYNFIDGAQNDIFEDSYIQIPTPSPVAGFPVLNETVAFGVDVPFASSGNVNASSSTGSVSGSNSSSSDGGLTDLDAGACITLNISNNTKRSIVANGSEGWKRSRIAAHLHRRQEPMGQSTSLAWVLFGWRKM
ncbi:hypothetical protein F5890DRAFT_1597425 [Lentinula detonsa]|uniref:Uncharacterized protein n=1 Tax=Lentinula detonsa TaxID=2804962 RepID=A0AA38PMV0_9AGAR|nr:hypothetical protein F5890DRAFT_1597425 [Lentinula detonsa]